MDEDKSAQGAPARDLVRLAMDKDVKVQGAPARGHVSLRTCIADSFTSSRSPRERSHESGDREPSPDIENSGESQK
ncbi:hypothetical protein PoB_000673500 [Plakobranchus ocellatus]|uniref:Uncharacterized protein n=1 Tax=Plakobranchus ocellatus TaxID=259542 RepID=A0AAV3YCI8_9GAST|nr:hypothetical protein PoB_000673500 [Plakobranchus ocellatus]